MLHCYDLISTAIKLAIGDKICVQYSLSLSISSYGLITRHKYNSERDSILGLE